MPVTETDMMNLWMRFGDAEARIRELERRCMTLKEQYTNLSVALDFAMEQSKLEQSKQDASPKPSPGAPK